MAQAGADSQNLGPANDGPGEQLRVLGKGRGRGRGKRRVDGSDVDGLGMHEFQQEVVGTYDTKMYEAVMRGDTEAVKAALLERTVKKDGEVPSFFSDYEAVMSSTNSVSERPVTLLPSPAVRPAPKKAATKTNGYCLFIKHMGRETDTVGSINELMAKFDKDWKSLSEDDRKMWKERAKSGWKPDFRKYGAGKGRKPQSTTQVQVEQPEKDYDEGEEDDEFY